MLHSVNDEEPLLAALRRRDLIFVASTLALIPSAATAVRPCRQPTTHYVIQNAEWGPRGTVSKATVEVLNMLVNSGAQLDAVESVTGNTVLHSACILQNGTGDATAPYAEDTAEVIEWICQHPQRPSFHARNLQGLTAVELAVRTGNAVAVDSLVAHSIEGPLLCVLPGGAAEKDELLDKALTGVPVAFAMGATLCPSVSVRCGKGYLLDGAVTHIHFAYRNWILHAAQTGNVSMLDYILHLTLPAGHLLKLLLLERCNSPMVLACDQEGKLAETKTDRVRIFDIFPQQHDEAMTTTLWKREGTPLQLCCASTAQSSLEVAKFILNYAASMHITDEEKKDEAARLAIDYHDHIPKKTPSAVLRCMSETDSLGRCSLHYAADGRRDGNTEIMALLLSVDKTLVNACDCGGRTPLESALRSKRQKNAEWLLMNKGSSGLGKQTGLHGIVAFASSTRQ